MCQAHDIPKAPLHFIHPVHVIIYHSILKLIYDLEKLTGLLNFLETTLYGQTGNFARVPSILVFQVSACQPLNTCHRDTSGYKSIFKYFQICIAYTVLGIRI